MSDAKNSPMPLKIADAFSMAGKAVIVTGAAGNVGTGIVDVFVANGVKVVLTDRADDRLTKAVADRQTRGEDVIGIPCDLTKPEELKSLIDQTLAKLGRIDAVINCGGIPTSGSILDEDVPDFDRMYHTNVRACWLLTKYCIEPMKAIGGGTVVNISSINGHRAFFLCSLYAGTKAALLAMTKELAVELAPYNIRINSVSPGSIPNPNNRMQWLLDQLNEPYRTQVAEEFIPKLDTAGNGMQPLQRTGHGHDVGMACYYLCTPAARFVTGEDILVDGGKLHEMHEGEPRFWNQNQSFYKQLRAKLLSFPDSAWKGEQPKWLQKYRQRDTAASAKA